jgi:vancomycin resistance protein YoaR
MATRPWCTTADATGRWRDGAQDVVTKSTNAALLRLAVALVVLAGLYVGLATFLSGHVPSNARVNGIAIGGMSPRDAVGTLDRLLATKVSRPVHLQAAARTVDLTPREAGLDVDLAATVEDLSGFTLNPVKLWEDLTGTVDEPLRLRIDHAKLDAAVTRAARVVDSRVRQGAITFTGGRTDVVLSAAGRKLNVPQTSEAVASTWPNQQVVQAEVKVTKPRLSAAELERAKREFAEVAMSAPVTVISGGTTIVLEPGQFAPALSAVPDSSGKLELRIDAPVLMAAIRGGAPDLEKPAVDATVRLVGARPTVIPASVGQRFDSAQVAALFKAAVTSSTRTVTIGLVPVTPKVTTATAQGWGIKGTFSTFTTHFPVNPPRTNNIRIAVATLNGTLVRPGGQFSLNATLGQRTAAKGYQKAPVIYGGRLESDYGGGVSQVSTTTFNAAFFAGVRFDQHTSHSFYIARYPEGREATVSWPDVDQKWTNDTGSGILIKASVQGNSITVTFLGTRKWDIEAVKGTRRNVVPPKRIVDARPGCVPQQPTPGFDVTVTQIFKKDGGQVRTVPFNTHYIPEDDVTCTSPKP